MNYLAKAILTPLVVSMSVTPLFAAKDTDIVQRFQEADANKDGLITHQEVMITVEKKFSEFDKNGDRYLELSELPKVMSFPGMAQKRLERRLEKRMDKIAEHSGREEADVRAHIEERIKKKRSRLVFVARLDRDGDERISVEEFASRKIRHFKKADKNGDGSVTLQELEDMGLRLRDRKGRHSKVRG